MDNRYFEDEEREEVFGNCVECDCELGIGHEVVIFEGEIFCDDVCLINYLSASRDYQKRTLREEDL
jgi:hypothetical protein